MIHFSTSLCKLLAIEVQQGANGYSLFHSPTSNDHLMYYEGETSFSSMKDKELPPGSYELLGRGKDISEQMWRWVVDNLSDTIEPEYEDYNRTKGSSYYMNATASGLSLLAANGIGEDWLILKIK